MSDDSPASISGGLASVLQPLATPERPWLGLAHFTEADRDYFHGRDSEVRELTDRVRRAPLTILYGVSGYGKSSLLGAGLIPALRAEGHPIVLLRRCYDDLASRPLQADVIAACLAAIPGSAAPAEPDAPTLWEFFHDRRQPWFHGAGNGDEDNSENIRDSAPWPVLLLDQFEEIFIKGEDRTSPDAATETRAREAARGFLNQLADLVENRPPADLRERLQTGPPADRRALVRRFDFQARPVHVAVAVRDDFLARLERWRRAMPSLMEHRMEMRLLSGPQAFRAVFDPGTKRPGRAPIFPEDVAAAIVRAAAGAQPDAPLEGIDAVPPILSLLCERLNDRRLAASPSRESITAADFSPGEAERILGRFYDDKLRAHPRALREYLEDKLVSDAGFRENVTLHSALASLRASVPDAEARLRQLVDDRVLVIEDRGGIPRAEFTHDTLARLALERRSDRQARARRRKAVAGILASLAIAGVSLALTVWALREKSEAGTQAESAKARQAEAEAATAEAQSRKAGALALIHFLDAQIGESFTDVPVQLRERVSDRLDAFYRSQGEPVSFEDRLRRMRHHLRRAMVHLATAERYAHDDDINQAARDFNIGQERESATVDLKEALRYGEMLATEAPDDRGVTRERILAHYQLSMVSDQIQDAAAKENRRSSGIDPRVPPIPISEVAAKELDAAWQMLDSLVRGSPYSMVLWTDWMGLPNLEAALGDRAAHAGDKTAARAWYQKAKTLQAELLARRPSDKERQDEAGRIEKSLAELAP